MNTSTDSDLVHLLLKRRSLLRFDVRWFPGLLLTLTVLLQIAVWDAPPDIRWDGSLNEWPIPWMVCCGSISGLICVMFAYVSAWIALIVVTFKTARRWILTNAAILMTFPVLIYTYMYLLYFG